MIVQFGFAKAMSLKTRVRRATIKPMVRIRRAITPVVASIVVIASGICFAQNTIRVPADRATIQAAILAASNGDTVLVSPGIYRERIDFSRKAITVKSLSGPDVTTIDGGRAGPVVS